MSFFKHHHDHEKQKISCLFICKQSEQEESTFHGYFRKYSGLFISARLVSTMIEEELNISSATIVAKDNNDIDRLVTKHKPTHVFIEAYWVVPEKFEILAKLHPNIKWIIRIHSEIPFIAVEGMSMDWTLRYLDYKNVMLAPNSPRIYDNIKRVLRQKYDEKFIDDRVVYLPNYYKPEYESNYVNCGKRHLDIGCFGSIRALKNQLVQAIAAMTFADSIGLPLHFHVNSNRIESQGDPVLKNIRQLFKHSKRHKLIEHPWMPHGEFKRLISTMEIGMQVSYTETFNIVTADFVTEGIPVVTSSEVWWLPSHVYADPNNVDDIIKKLKRVWTGRLFKLQKLNFYGLKEYSNNSKEIWNNFLNEDKHHCERK